jgi:hypothetical protein
MRNDNFHAFVTDGRWLDDIPFLRSAGGSFFDDHGGLLFVAH